MEDSERVKFFLRKLHRLPPKLQWASALIRESLPKYEGVYSTNRRLPDDDWICMMEYAFDHAFTDLQNARQDSLFIVNWFDPKKYDEYDEPDIHLLIESMRESPVIHAQGLVNRVLDGAAKLWLADREREANNGLELEQGWMIVQDQIRVFRRRMTQWVPPSELVADIECLIRSCDELDLAADRLTEVWNVLSDEYEPVRAGDPHWRRAPWFSKKIAQRCRQASQPLRNTMRVRSKTEGRVVFYSAADAFGLWPDLVPNPEQNG